MAQCNPSELLNAAKCFSCLSKKELQAVIAQLLCNISSNSGGCQKIFRGIITQEGMGIPTIQTIINTLGTTLTASRDDVGQYEIVPTPNADFPNGFPLTTTYASISNYSEAEQAGIHLLGTGEIEIFTSADGQLEGNFFEIIVHC